MAGVKPFAEQRAVPVGEITRAEARDAFFARDALEQRPDFRELHDRRRVKIHGLRKSLKGFLALQLLTPTCWPSVGIVITE